MAKLRDGKDGSVSIEGALKAAGLQELGGGVPYKDGDNWVFPNIGPLEAADGWDHPPIGSLPERPFTPKKMSGGGGDPKPGA